MSAASATAAPGSVVLSAGAAGVEAPVACTLSIIIVSWNTRDLLTDCLVSVSAALRAAPDVDAEVFVVDNASSDGTAERVRERFPDVLLIENGANLGFARANNRALAVARGRYWLLLNPDTVVPPGALPGLARALDEHPEAAACGPVLLNADGSLQPSWARFPGPRSELSGALDRSQSPYTVEELADPARREVLPPFPVDWVGGACLLLRADAVRRAGPLDEGFFFYAEETELQHRLRRVLGEDGGKTLLVPGVAVTHLGGQSSRSVPHATRRRLVRSSLLLYRRIYGPSAPIPWLAGSALAIARYLLWHVRRRRSCQ